MAELGYRHPIYSRRYIVLASELAWAVGFWPGSGFGSMTSNCVATGDATVKISGRGELQQWECGWSHIDSPFCRLGTCMRLKWHVVFLSWSVVWTSASPFCLSIYTQDSRYLQHIFCTVPGRLFEIT